MIQLKIHQHLVLGNAVIYIKDLKESAAQKNRQKLLFEVCGLKQSKRRKIDKELDHRDMAKLNL